MTQVGDRKPKWEFSLLHIYPELPIVPIRYVLEDDGKIQKEPLWKWGKWENGGQSEEDRRRAIELFERGECDGLAIVCGTPVRIDGETFYFFAIDIDLPAEEAVRILGEAGIVTRFEKTMRGRLHAYFLSRRPVESKDKPIELKGHGKLIVVYPSREYNTLNESPPSRVDDALEIFRKVCRALGYDVEDEREIPREFVPLIDALVKIWEPGHRHYLALWLSGYLRKLGWSQKVVEAVLEEIADRANDRELKDRLRALEDTYSKDPEDIAGSSRLKEELQAIVGPEEAEKIMNLIPRREPEVEGISKPRERAILSFVFPDGRVAEAIGIRNALGEYDPALLILGPEGFKKEREVLVGDTMFRGMDPRAYPYEPYVIEDLENVKSRVELVEMIRAEVNRFIDVSEEEKAIFTAYVLMSYCPELFEKVPYLYLVGDNSSGKSHTLQLLAYLCYRPLYGVSIPPADIYSYLGKEKGDPPMTIIEDEFQGSDRDTEKMKIYKAGYKRGARVPRIAIDQNGRRRQEFYNAFGPKVVAAEELIENKGFLERCVVIKMVKGRPEKDHYDREDEARFAKLRAELLKWRMMVLADREKLPRLELEWLEGRDRELYLPLLTVLEGTPLYSILEEKIRKLIERKREELRGSLEAQITAVVLELAKGLGAEIPFSRIWDRLKERLNADVSPKPSVAIETAMDTEAYGRITKNKVGAILRDKLGLERVKTHRDGKFVVLYRITDSEKIRRTAIKYGLEDPLPINSLIAEGSG
jgi:hypothetical protein